MLRQQKIVAGDLGVSGRFDKCRDDAIAGAVLTEDAALGTQNAVLFVINLIGVFRYLLRAKPV